MLIAPVKLRNYTIELLHEILIGMAQIIKRARFYYDWPKMVSDIENCISRRSAYARY